MKPQAETVHTRGLPPERTDVDPDPGRVQSRGDVIRGLRIRTRFAGRSTTGQPTAGSPLPVVLVHGLGVSSRYMMPLLEHLGPSSYTLAPDLPGFGRSEGPRRAFDVPAMAAFLDDWADAMPIERAVWLGNSFGCQVLVDLALRRPDRVAGLVLQGMTPDVRRSALQHVVRLGLDAVFEPPSLVFIAAFDYLRAGVPRCWRTFRHLMADPIEAKLPLVQAPAIVMRGRWDPIVSEAWTERAAALLPRGRQVFVPGSAHAVNYSHPERLAPLLLSLSRSAQ